MFLGVLMLDEHVQAAASRVALVNGKLILRDSIASGRALIVEDDRIAEIRDASNLPPDLAQVDVGGRFVAPGLVDLHTHGAVGHDFGEATDEAFAAVTKEQLSRGVTSLLATLSTAPVERLADAMATARRWMGAEREGSRIVGVHVEGPYFSPAQAGAQAAAHMRTPDDGSPERLLEFRDVIRIMTYAPELPGAVSLTSRLRDLGIVPAAGHSSAQEGEVSTAVAAGLRHVIHMWSGQSTTVREGPWRKPGLLEAALASDDLTVEIIADGKHLPGALMRIAYKCAGPDRLCAVSDSTAGAGLPDGSRFRLGEVEHEVCDGVGMTFDRTAFAGSTSLLNEMIPVLTDVVGIPLVEAVRMCSSNPARVIGLDDRKGSLEVGKDADVAVFDPDFTAWAVMSGGRWVGPSAERLDRPAAR